MINPKLLEDLVAGISDALPPGVTRLPDDLRRNIRAAVSAALAKAELVTREEWDVQAAVLARTREKVERLEKRVAALEAQRLDRHGPPG